MPGSESCWGTQLLMKRVDLVKNALLACGQEADLFFANHALPEDIVIYDTGAEVVERISCFPLG